MVISTSGIGGSDYVMPSALLRAGVLAAPPNSQYKQLIALAALKTFPNIDVNTKYGRMYVPTLMTAIGGAESSFNPFANGDLAVDYPDLPQCGGYTSFGTWQIHTIHYQFLISATGSHDPCVWAKWLYNIDNNARAAASILGSNLDFAAWSSYNDGGLLNYVGDAQAVVADIVEYSTTRTSTSSSSVATSSSSVIPVAAGVAVGAIGLGLVIAGLRGGK